VWKFISTHKDSVIRILVKRFSFLFQGGDVFPDKVNIGGNDDIDAVGGADLIYF
jgi:hypothetical protein